MMLYERQRQYRQSREGGQIGQRVSSLLYFQTLLNYIFTSSLLFSWSWREGLKHVPAASRAGEASHRL